MRNLKMLILWVVVYMPFLLFSQKKIPTSKDLIQVETSMSSPKFYLNNEKVPLKEIEQRIAVSPVALKYFKKGKTNLTLDYIFGTVGGFALGWQIGGFIFRRTKLNPIILGSSVGLIGIDLYVHNAANKSFKKAMDIYKDDKIGQVKTIKYPCKLGINQDGSLALVVSF